MPQLPSIPLYRAAAVTAAAAPVRAMGGPGSAVADAPAPALPNPALRLEPALGLVVLEFRNSAGEVAATIPTRRELEAYRSAARTSGPAAAALAAPVQTSNPPAGSSPSSPDRGETVLPASVAAAATT